MTGQKGKIDGGSEVRIAFLSGCLGNWLNRQVCHYTGTL